MKALLTAFAILSIGFSTYASTDIEKIIGDNDLIAVNAEGSNIPLMYRSIINAFGHISMGCTATHIGNGYVLTAGHCFYAEETLLRDQDCAGTTVEWGVREGLEPYMVSNCEKVIAAQRDGTNDFAIMKVSPIPPVAVAPELNRRAAIGDSVTIFSHPEELPLRWSQLCGIERDRHPDLPDGAIHHQCDTNPGSSGATIINIVSMKVIGIHDGGLNGSDPTNPDHSPVNMGMNYGTYIMNSPLFDILKEIGY